MKKTITFLTLIIAMSLFAQTTYVPDDNFEQALIDLGYDSGTLDDYVPTANINSITVLNVSSKGITNLTGIEDFTALEDLNCSQNALTSIDISSNTNLTQLRCYSNSLTILNTNSNTLLTDIHCSQNQISTLDLSQNTVLINLTCTHNLLTNLDTSTNTVLALVTCYNNSITSLDFSQNTALAYLNCKSNNLTELNVSNGNNTSFSTFDARTNPNLTCIQVDDVSWSTTNWTNIDAASSFSLNCHFDDTYIPDDNFEQALIDAGYDSGALDDYVPTVNINTVTILNLNNKNITDTTGMEAFLALETLWFNSNLVTSIDLSQNTNLINAYLAFNNLTSLDVSQNTALINLTFSGNNVSSIDLTTNTALELFYCYANPLGTLDITNNIALKDLKCYNTQIASLDVSQNTGLIGLDCRSNNLTSLDLSQNTVLTYLNCKTNALTTLNVKNNNNTNFTSFDARLNPNLTCILVDNATWSTTNWTNIDAIASFSVSCTPPGMTYVPDDNFEQALIDLGYDSGALDDFVTTANISALTSLDVSSKSIIDLTGIEGFVALTNLKCNNNQITAIDISQNIALTNFECHHNQLTSLDVSLNTAIIGLNCGNNQITSLDVTNLTNLSTLFCSNNSIPSLDLSNNGSLTFLSCRSNQLTTLDLSNNPLVTNVVSEGNNIHTLNIASNTALTTLLLNNNQLTELDISNNTAITYFGVQGNQLTRLNVKNGNNTNFVSFNAMINPNLTCIEVDDPAWSTTNWTFVDASATFSLNCHFDDTYVPDDNFEQALIDLGYDSGALDDYVPTANINTVANLDVSGKGITDLTGIEGFVALETLSCATNTLTSVDISQNTALTSFICATNQLTNLDVSQNTNLTFINCRSNQLTSLDVSNNTALTTLFCFLNQITSLDLSQNTVLTYLNCKTNALTALNIKNGNNTNMTDAAFDARFNSGLTCIIVDDATWSTSTWTKKDATATFVNDQAACSALYIAETSLESSFMVYPNPIKDSFSINSTTSKPIETLIIYNTLGKVVYKTKQINGQINGQINTTSLSNGIYFLKIFSDNKTVTKKILINK